MGRRVPRRVLRRGFKKGLSRKHLEGRSTPFRESVGVCPSYAGERQQGFGTGLYHEHGNGCYSTLTAVIVL